MIGVIRVYNNATIKVYPIKLVNQISHTVHAVKFDWVFLSGTDRFRNGKKNLEHGISMCWPTIDEDICELDRLKIECYPRCIISRLI